MPTYQYECSACGHGFEELQTMTEARLTKCPQCGRKKLDRLIGSGAGMIFKGTGFYATDYKKSVPAGDKSDTKTDSAKELTPSPAPASPAKSVSSKGGGSCGGTCACHPA